MRKLIKTRDLKVGMYVVLDLPWHRHPFLRSSFLLSSEKDIQRMLTAGIEEAFVDLALSEDLPSVERNPTRSAALRKALPPSPTWNPETLIPPELREAIGNARLAPTEKAGIVRKSCLILMDRLLESPTAENIHAAKGAIYDVVDLIMSEQEMTQHLLEITSHDYYTYAHSVNVGILSLSLAKVFFDRLSFHDMRELGAAFFLHDIGKVRIDSSYINKPGKLTDDEMQQMKKHPIYGFNILHKAQAMSEECRLIVMEHHERADGSGYPAGLRDNQIHIYARICSLADVYDALTSRRSYKQAMVPFQALKVMKEEMIGHFQQGLFEAFIKMLS